MPQQFNALWNENNKNQIFMLYSTEKSKTESAHYSLEQNKQKSEANMEKNTPN